MGRSIIISPPVVNCNRARELCYYCYYLQEIDVTEINSVVCNDGNRNR